ncbi:PAS domain-containing hybrid sensor histidine kinase/response regulator [Brevundimonas basaltis]|uniref:histidine kinase n=1 Tax=Brevundimonas basaltis TaxID=472166 RepID=A0A7W8HYJ6_9CAUL|nr:PAS domain-containing hybrid sensor histidine kinase/response regulator [Brevundimonas basaltis]MBB5291443.1 signal transduction histidine kinase [Brevundimonas basaltis]
MGAQEHEVTSDTEALFEDAPCGYLIADETGRIIRANRTLAEWLSQKAGDFEGRRFSDLLNIAGKIYYETHFAPLLRMQGFFHEVALDLVRPGQDPLPVLVNAAERASDGGARRIVITVFNATDRRRYERELLEARREAEAASSELHQLNLTLEARVAEAVSERLKTEEALRQAQKMEAVGQLTGGVAHDFNNLLTVILGGLETVSRQVSGDPTPEARRKIERAVAMATHGAQRAATLTARLLAFARRQPLDPRPVDAGRLVTGLADLLQRTLGEAVAFETVSGAGLWPTNVDSAELENALVNLAVNARDAMPEGGRLTIETGNAFLDEDYVASIVEPVRAGQYVLIAVTDTGTGMAADTVSKVFEPFFTTKEAGRGTGLGLSQVYGFVRQSGGHIRIYSELGHGTTIKIYLPRSDGALPEIATTAEKPPSAGGYEKILLVEDHDDLRAYSVGVLEELGYEVLEASNGRAALEVLQSHNDIALLFTDVVMPDGINGRQLADEAVRRRPGIKVLYTTGYTRNAIVHNGTLDAGVNLISKPFTFRELADKVRRVLDA